MFNGGVSDGCHESMPWNRSCPVRTTPVDWIWFANVLSGPEGERSKIWFTIVRLSSGAWRHNRPDHVGADRHDQLAHLVHREWVAVGGCFHCVERRIGV